MPGQVDFKAFAAGGGANVITQAEYTALLAAALANGFVAGVAPSDQLNKVWRQSSVMSAAVAEAVSEILNDADVLDDGDVDALKAQLILAMQNAGNQNYVTDTGAADAYEIELDPAITAYDNGLPVLFRAANTNTGASTLDAGGGAVDLKTNTAGDLAAGDIAADELVWAVYDAGEAAFLIVARVQSQFTSMSTGKTPGGRLTATTGVPVTTADVTNAATVYYTPAVHNGIERYDGGKWVSETFAELSQALADNTKSPAAAGNNANYDMFYWNDAGTKRCTRGPAWATDTARGAGAGTTELELFEGRYVNKNAVVNGPAARRGVYVGTIRTNGTATLDDSAVARFCWNAFNQMPRPLVSPAEPANSWTYSTNTWRQSNANAANQFKYVQGLSLAAVKVKALSIAQSSDGTLSVASGVGIDVTNLNSAQIYGSRPNTGGFEQYIAHYEGFPGIGAHTIAWLEKGAGTTTWLGDDGGAVQSGMTGEIAA